MMPSAAGLICWFIRFRPWGDGEIDRGCCSVDEFGGWDERVKKRIQGTACVEGVR